MAHSIEEKKFASIGDRTFLVELVEQAVPVPQAIAYARIIAENYRLRQLAKIGRLLKEQAEADGAESQNITNWLEAELTKLCDNDQRDTLHSKNLSCAFAERLLQGPQAVDRSRIIETRLPYLNSKLGGGLHKGHLVVIGGSPSMGKSSLALDIVLNNGNYGKRSLIFAIDETTDDIIYRAFQNRLGFDPKLLNDCGPFSDAQKGLIEEQRKALSNQPWSVIEASGMTVYDIRSRARAYKRRHGLDIIVIDYIGQIRPVGKNQTREREMAEISATLKETAKDLDCCLIAVSQLNRNVQTEPLYNANNSKKRRLPLPRMSHLKDSGAIEADANVVLLPFLPFEYLKERLGEHHDWIQEEKGQIPDALKAKIIIAKNKTGPKGIVNCHFHTKRMRFFTPVPGRQPDLIDQMQKESA